jgi:hypothetical protein
MEERILCPIGLLFLIFAVYIQFPAASQLIGSDSVKDGISADSFLHKQYWPIQVRPPPLFSRCFRTLLC